MVDDRKIHRQRERETTLVAKRGKVDQELPYGRPNGMGRSNGRSRATKRTNHFVASHYYYACLWFIIYQL